MGVLDDIIKRAEQFGYRARTAAPGGPTAAISSLLPQQAQPAFNAINYLPSRLFDTLDLVGDAGSTTGKALSGLGFAAMNTPLVRHSLGVNHVAPDTQAFLDAASQAMGNPANGDFFQRALAANEAGAGKNSVVSGLSNLVLDPTNLLTPAAEGLGLLDKTPLYTQEGLSAAQRASVEGRALKLSVQDAIQAQKDAFAGKNVAPVTMRNLMGDWKSATVGRFRNSGMQDRIFNWLMARENNIPGEAIQQRLASTVDSAETLKSMGQSLQHSRPASTDLLLRLTGADKYYDPVELGLGALESGGVQKHMNPLVSAATQVGYGLMNPLRPNVPLLGSVFDAAFGLARPAHNQFYSTYGHLLQTAARTEPLDRVMGSQLGQHADEFLTALRQQVTPKVADDLLQMSQQSHAAALKIHPELVSRLPDNALFNSSDIATALANNGIKPNTPGNKAAIKVITDAWDTAVKSSYDAGTAEARRVFGDFRNTGSVSKAVDTLIPFLSWVRVAYPRTFQSMMKEPSVTAAIANGLNMSTDELQRNGLPDYLTGTVPVSTDAPLGAGLLARGYLGGKEGTAHVGFMNLFSPLAPEITGLSSLADKSIKPVQKAQEIGNMLGIAGFNPLLQPLLYAGGLTDQVPQPMSAYAGIEQAMPGGAGLPSLLNGVLNVARKAGGNSQISDPIETQAKKMVFEQTGATLDAPQNKQYALDIANKTGIYQEAKKVVDAQGAFRAGAQYFNPTSVTTTDTTTEAYDKAKYNEGQVLGAILSAAGVGDLASKTPAELGNLDPNVAQLIQGMKTNIAGANPLHDLYSNATLSSLDKQDPRLTAWQMANQNLRDTFPGVYAQQEAAFMAALGIKGNPVEPPKRQQASAPNSAPTHFLAWLHK